ncbi:MAG TPA: FtsX-like permease family protein, partial [Pilimelia sp.]|nr:FtsX-like permease family protein [Pilimelia sp.]
RASFGSGIGGAPATVTLARQGTGRELGRRPAGATGPHFAAPLAVDDLPGRAELAAGAWPVDGPGPVPVTLPAGVAAVLGLRVGDEVSLTDRATGTTAPVRVAALWRPRDPADPYWQLVPGVFDATAGARTTWPLLMSPAALRRLLHGAGTDATWLAAPRLTGGDVDRLAAAAAALPAAGSRATAAAGLDGARVETAGPELADALRTVRDAGRSALAGPLGLLVMLSGYTLFLLGSLLHEARWRESALLRARGATRGQLAQLAAAEAALCVAPAAVAAPLLAVLVLRALGHGAAPAGAVPAAVGAGAGALAVAALALPALRVGDRYVGELAAHTRAARFGAVPRAGLDLALTAGALLAWYQLRAQQPVRGVDPLLVVAPTLAVLAGAALALRAAPPLVALVERVADRRGWHAALLGVQHVGRRPHAGPLVLLAAGAAVTASSWSTIGTWQRSLDDQATHRVGADVRVAAPTGAATAAPAAASGVRAAVAVARGTARIGPTDGTAAVLAVAPRPAAPVLRWPDGTGPAALRRMADRTGPPAGVPMPAAAGTLAGVLSPVVPGGGADVFVTAADGRAWRLAARPAADGRFRVPLPEAGLHLAGFEISAPPEAPPVTAVAARALVVLDAGGRRAPVTLGRGWVVRADQGTPAPATVRGGAVRAVAPGGPPPARVRLLAGGAGGPVPLVCTDALLTELRAGVGTQTALPLGGVSVPVVVAGRVAAVPTVAQDRAVLVDRVALSRHLVLHGVVETLPDQEWWLSGDPHAAAAAARTVPGAVVQDRRALAAADRADPYWGAVRGAYLVVGVGAALIALAGFAVHARASSRRRLDGLAVLHALGARPGWLARAVVAEQTLLVALGVTVGVLVGAAVASALAPLVVLTSAGARPFPAPALVLPWPALTATGAVVITGAALLSAWTARRVTRGDIGRAARRIGAEP